MMEASLVSRLLCWKRIPLRFPPIGAEMFIVALLMTRLPELMKKVTPVPERVPPTSEAVVVLMTYVPGLRVRLAPVSLKVSEQPGKRTTVPPVALNVLVQEPPAETCVRKESGSL